MALAFGTNQTQTVTEVTLCDFQDKVAAMYVARGYIIDWYADTEEMARSLSLPHIDWFSSFHSKDPEYVTPSSIESQPRPYQSAHGTYQSLSRDVILTAHQKDQPKHSIAVFVQTTGVSFKKEQAEAVASFLRFFRIRQALFGVAVIKSLTAGAAQRLYNQPDFAVQLMNIEDSALSAVHNCRVPPHIRRIPKEEHKKFLTNLQCRRPLALHRKNNPYTPYVLSGQDPRDKVSRYYDFQEGDLVLYGRTGTASGQDEKVRHVRDRGACASAASSIPLDNLQTGGKEGGGSGSAGGRARAASAGAKTVGGKGGKVAGGGRANAAAADPLVAAEEGGSGGDGGMTLGSMMACGAANSSGDWDSGGGGGGGDGD